MKTKTLDILQVIVAEIRKERAKGTPSDEIKEIIRGVASESLRANPKFELLIERLVAGVKTA